MHRRKFIKKTILGGLAAGLSTGFYAWQIEPFWLEFTQVKMDLPNLPKSMVGKKIMQISDMHVGDRFDYQFLIDAFAKAKKYNPDIVVYTGDFVNYESSKQFKQFAEVMKYAVKGKLASLAVLGNHDYGFNWAQQSVADRITQQIQKTGIRVLSNNYVDIQGIRFIGMDDYWGPNFDPIKALSFYHKKKTNIVLCHNPDTCDLKIWKDINCWVLSGHTHGGQCKPPFLKPPILPVKNKTYTAGTFTLAPERKLYINRALGHLKQVRFNVRPEITLFELTARPV